jgi:hypothetical protein
LPKNRMLGSCRGNRQSQYAPGRRSSQAFISSSRMGHLLLGRFHWEWMTLGKPQSLQFLGLWHVLVIFGFHVSFQGCIKIAFLNFLFQELESHHGWRGPTFFFGHKLKTSFPWSDKVKWANRRGISSADVRFTCRSHIAWEKSCQQC